MLVIRLGAVGDVVRLLPAAAAVREAYPAAQLAWLVEPASASVVRAQPWIDDVIEFPRGVLRDALRRVRPFSLVRELAGFASALRGRRFDLVLDFHAILKSGALARLTGAQRRIGYAAPFGREGSWLFATDRARIAPRRMSRFERNAGLLRFLAVDEAVPRQPLAVDPETQARLRGALDGAHPVALHPGTSPGTPHKRWDAAGFAALARTLADRHGLSCVVTHGPAPGERALAESIVAAAGPDAARVAPETGSLADLAALFSLCRAYVGGDTGPLHVASLVGTPVVQLLGPTHPVENAPWPGTPSRVVRVPVACSPCRRGCAAAYCMRGIHPDSVADAVTALVAGGRDG